jgi:hypothetical protein
MANIVIPVSIDFLQTIGTLVIDEEHYEKLKSRLYVAGIISARSAILGTVVNIHDDNSFDIVEMSFIDEKNYQDRLTRQEIDPPK